MDNGKTETKITEDEDCEMSEFKRDSTVLLEEEEEQGGTVVEAVEEMEVEVEVEGHRGMTAEERKNRRHTLDKSIMMCWFCVIIGIILVVLGSWVYELEEVELYTDFLKAECKIVSGGVLNAVCKKADCVQGMDSSENPDDVPCSEYGFEGEQVVWFSEVLHRYPPISTTLYGDCFKVKDDALARKEEMHHLNTTLTCYYNSVLNIASTMPPALESTPVSREKAVVALVSGSLLIVVGLVIYCFTSTRLRIIRK
eukprot:TRINITY_DN14589_c0_g1_i1.p1 TRINITY_DN14589_c0_g1~~TRINITY_DN14589_c0_g1_i1.p1  ORF type:complete len:265 (+),score=40.86 TRINITY_DN14589_c0_g1_i1:35-796(+)